MSDPDSERQVRIERVMAEIHERSTQQLLELSRAKPYSGWSAFFAGFAIVAVGALMFFAALLLSDMLFDRGVSRTQEHRACDIIVARFMATEDRVELERDVHLINWMNCGVTNRVAAVLAPEYQPRELP